MSTERGRILSPSEIEAANATCAGPGPAELALAVRQFNDGDYFECHETLEDLWRAERGPVRRVYQGILHIAVGLYHLRRDNRHGALVKLRSGLGYLAPFPDHCHGLDLAGLRASTAANLAALETLTGDDAFDWSRAPYLTRTS